LMALKFSSPQKVFMTRINKSGPLWPQTSRLFKDKFGKFWNLNDLVFLCTIYL
jgi:hypothetical protein